MKTMRPCFIFILFPLIISACSGRQLPEPAPSDFAPQVPFGAKRQEKRIVIVGDSLSEGLGVAAEESYPAVLERLLREKGKAVAITNAGVSGARSSSAVSRVRWALKSQPSILVLALGANDALQGGAVADLRKNLGEAILEAKKAGVSVLLVGMKAPPNLGPRYCQEFDASFPILAREFKVPLVPFLLESVAANPKLNQGDMKHPNPEGHKKMAENVLPHLERLL